MGWVNPRGPMQLVGADWQLGVELARSSFMILAVKPASHRGIRSERGGHYILIIQMHATRDHTRRVGIEWNLWLVESTRDALCSQTRDPPPREWHPGAWPCQHWRLDGGGDLAHAHASYHHFPFGLHRSRGFSSGVEVAGWVLNPF